jgi:16S rRNA (cytosine967-C5)-methyltransferase
MWLLEKWVGDRGLEATEALARSNNIRPDSAFRITARGERDGVTPNDDWDRSRYVPGGYSAKRMTPRLRELAESGRVYFQDEGSQLIGSLVDLPPGSKFLDVSAAPGSKTTLIASSAPADATIVAGDVRQSRVRVLRGNCEAQGVDNVLIVRHDAESALPFADGEFGTVLLDAPCSGTGTIRSNPEIRYFLKPGDFDELHRKQLAILRNASKTVRRGGRLIYSTCSLEPEENEQVVSEFLAGDKDFELIRPDMAPELLTVEGFMRTTPADNEMDGFFAAVLNRRA